MTNSYLLDIIKTFRAEEREEMVLFLQSPLFNQGVWKQELITLYQIILTAAPAFTDADLNKERVYGLIFQEKEMVRGKLEKLMSELNKLLRQYALWKRSNSEKNEQLNQINWVSWLRERGLRERFQQLMAKIKNGEEGHSHESLETYNIALKIAEEEHEWKSENNRIKNDLNLPDLIYCLDAYYFNYRTELLNRFLLQQKAAQLPPIEWMEPNIEVHQKYSVLLRFSLKLQTILKKDSPLVEDFYELLNLVQTNNALFTFQWHSQLFAYIRSLGTILLNNGHLEVIPTLHRIHQENLKDGYLYFEGKMPLNPYLNLVQIAIRAGDVMWAKAFTEKYKNDIYEGDEDHHFYQLNLATCLFAEGKLEEALAHIPPIPSALHYHMMTRLLELKIYYEQRSDLLHFKIFAFRKYIERTAPKSLSAKLREMNLNFLNILLQITQSPLKDKKRSERLVARIQEKTAISERAWLIEKAKELG